MKNAIVALLLVTSAACGSSTASGPNNDTLARPPGTEVDKEACGPAPGAPAIQCSDGSTGGNTGRCIVQADGQIGWEMRECPLDDEGVGDPDEGGDADGVEGGTADGSAAGA
jgi:hypothetical protein